MIAEAHDSVLEALSAAGIEPGPPFTVEETAAVFRSCAKTVYDQIRRGEIRAIRVGRCLRVSRAEVGRILAGAP